MDGLDDHREFKRIAIDNRVQVRADGRAQAQALAVNVSMGGLLLAPGAPLQVGRPCELAISLSNGHEGFAVVAKGVVVRSGERETAFQFLNALDRSLYEKVVARHPAGLGQALADAYVHYFTVSRDEHHPGAERWFGVTGRTFRKVILATFCASLALAAGLAWLSRPLFPPGLDVLKIVLSYGFGWAWVGALLPPVDLAILGLLKMSREKRQERLGLDPKPLPGRPGALGTFHVGSVPFRVLGGLAIGTLCALIVCAG